MSDYTLDQVKSSFFCNENELKEEYASLAELLFNFYNLYGTNIFRKYEEKTYKKLTEEEVSINNEVLELLPMLYPQGSRKNRSVRRKEEEKSAIFVNISSELLAGFIVFVATASFSALTNDGFITNDQQHKKVSDSQLVEQLQNIPEDLDEEKKQEYLIKILTDSKNLDEIIEIRVRTSEQFSIE